MTDRTEDAFSAALRRTAERAFEGRYGALSASPAEFKVFPVEPTVLLGLSVKVVEDMGELRYDLSVPRSDLDGLLWTTLVSVEEEPGGGPDPDVPDAGVADAFARFAAGGPALAAELRRIFSALLAAGVPREVLHDEVDRAAVAEVMES